MGKKSPPPKPPDLTPISDAQLEISQEANELAREYLGLSRDQFEWMQQNATEELNLAREQADRLFEYQDRVFASDQEAKDFARQVGQTQIDAMNLQMDYARRDRQRYEDVFLPMQDRFIDDANAYDTPQRREAEAARAMVDIQRQADAQRENADARLRSMGIDPSQVRSSSMLNQLGVANGANQALAGNNARTMVEDKGRALRADALNIGMGLPAQAAAGFQGANASGAGAVNAGQAGQNATLNAVQGGAGVAGTAMGFRSNALNNVAALTGSPMQWASMGGNMMGQAMSGYGQAANTMSQNFNNQMSSWQAGQQQSQQNFSNIMSVAGMAAGMMMSEGGSVERALETSGKSKKRGRLDDWRARMAEKNPDQYIRTGAGHGEGGALDWRDRLQNGMTAASMYQPENLFSGPVVPPGGNMQPIMAPVQFSSEGGMSRAIPTLQSRDKIHAMLDPGEYVLPSDVVRAIGLEKLDKMVAKYHRENS